MGPIFHKDPTASQNGLPIIRFDGSDDALEIAYALGASTDFTIFLVYSSALTTELTEGFFGMWDDHDGPFTIHGGTAGAIFAGTDVAGRIDSGDGLTYTAGANIIMLRKSGTGSENLTGWANGS